jgi:hypothetical protein
MPRMSTTSDLERLPTAAPTTLAPESDLSDPQWQIAVCIALQSVLDGCSASLVSAFRAAISAREHSRTRRAATRAHLSRILDALGCAALVMSLDGRVVYETKGFRRLVTSAADGEMVRRAAARQALTLAGHCREHGCADRDDVDTSAGCTATGRLRT